MNRAGALREARGMIYRHERKRRGWFGSWCMAWNYWWSLRSLNDEELARWVLAAKAMESIIGAGG